MYESRRMKINEYLNNMFKSCKQSKQYKIEEYDVLIAKIALNYNATLNFVEQILSLFEMAEIIHIDKNEKCIIVQK